jgi:uncharacterized caspase-like protein
LPGRTISSDELWAWLRDIDAGEMVMIVDASHSAASVEGTGFKPGPMGSRGLGQLAYDKGIRIITASHADDVAIESAKIRHRLLTYALVHGGLAAAQAEFRPQDQTILLSEWLKCADERVPALYAEVRSGKLQNFGKADHTRDAKIVELGGSVKQEKSHLEQPALFDCSKRQRDTVLQKMERR